MVYWKSEICTGSKSYSLFKYTGSLSLYQPRQISFPFGKFPTQVGLLGGWWCAGPAKNKHYLCLLQVKQIEQNLSKSFGEWCCRDPKIHWTWIFGRPASQIISLLNREGYFK